MKMREYVDGIQGAGAWDRMHDLIGRKQLFGWAMPPVQVDGHHVSIFPGEDREVTLEAVQDELRKVFASVEAGEFTDLPPLGDSRRLQRL